MHPPSGPARPPLSAEKAVLIGHLAVNGPVTLIMLAGAVLGFFVLGWMGVPLFVVPSAAVAWLWWSFFVPRWRRWALRGGADPDRLQSLGQMTGLVWPKGFFLEKTEFRLKDDADTRPG
jgi:hypothetical protein